MLQQVTILSTGGTIASTDSKQGAKPSKRGEELVKSLPELNELADITVEQVSQKPSNDMDIETLAKLAERAQQVSQSEADGIVVTHGTDTMEESAYYLDLVDNIEVPVIFTGSQRRPDEVSPDGDHNLITAVRAAVNEHFQRSNGSFIVFNDEAHLARHAIKDHTTKVEAFVSPGIGPAALFTRDEIRPYRDLESQSETIPVSHSNKTVRIIPSAVGEDGKLVNLAIEEGADGLVVEGFGLGNTTGDIGDEIRTAIEANAPVVVTSRCSEGPLAPIYGGRGGAKTLFEHGVLDGDTLSPQKARIKLMLVLEYVDTHKQAAEFF